MKVAHLTWTKDSEHFQNPGWKNHFELGLFLIDNHLEYPVFSVDCGN